MKNVRSSQLFISMNFCIEFSKARIEPTKPPLCKGFHHEANSLNTACCALCALRKQLKKLH